MRFHTTHLMMLVAVCAVIFGLARHPEALRVLVVPLTGGVFVVLPVLGIIEWMWPASKKHPEIGLAGVSLIICVALLGSVVALCVGVFFLTLLQ